MNFEIVGWSVSSRSKDPKIEKYPTVFDMVCSMEIFFIDELEK